MAARVPRLVVVAALGAVLAASACGLRAGDDDGPDCPEEVDGCHRAAVVGDIGDGDSFRLEDGERVRMIGIDTPEVDEDECHATEARDALRELIPRGSRIRLEFDEERTDRFGRTLAYVYREDDLLFVNLELARRGHADSLVVRPNDAFADDIADAVEDARAEGLGRWGACAG